MAGTATSATSRNKQRSKAAAAADVPVSKRDQVRTRDAELAPKVRDARAEGKSWADIKAEFGVDQPKGQVLIKMANLKPAQRIKWETDEDLGKHAVELRDKVGLPWADIAVRAGVTNAKVKQVYELVKGDGAASESRIRQAAPDKTAAAGAKAPGKTAKAGAKPAAKAGAKPGAKPAVNKTRTRRRAAADPSPAA